MSHNAPSTLKAQIEGMWAAGRRSEVIAAVLGTKLSYVDQVIYFANRRPTPVSELQGDDDKHLGLIFQSNNGMGFPYCVERARAA